MDRLPKEDAVKGVTINDLDDDILRLVMKELTITEQVVNSRLSKRFIRFVTAIEITRAFRKYISEDGQHHYFHSKKLDTIAFANALKLIERFPNLVSIHKGSQFWLDKVDRGKLNDFIRKVAMINPKLRYICKNFEVDLLYVMTVKELNPDYTASHFKHVFSFYEYQKAISKYPDLDLEYEYCGGYAKDVVSSHYKSEKVVRLYVLINSEALGLKMLANAIRLTHLNLSITWKKDFFQLKNVLQAISRPSLKSLILFIGFLSKQGWSVSYSLTRDDLCALEEVFQIPSLMNCTMKVNDGWNDGIRDVFQSYLDSDRKKIMQIRLTTNDGIAVIEPKSLYNYRIEIPNPERFPFASFLSKYRTREIMVLTFCDVTEGSKAAIVATCSAFAEQNPNRSFHLLFLIKVFTNDIFQKYLEIEEELYKFNQDSKTVQRFDSEYLRENPYR